MTDEIQVDTLEKDALKEIGNIGTGNAATALSTFLNQHIEIIIPAIEFVDVRDFSKQFGGPEKVVVASYLEISGDIKGESLFICPTASAEKMADLMLGQPIGTSKIVDEMSQSVYKEISNIFVGAYLNSIADFLEMKILPSVPHLATDMFQAIIDALLIKVANHSDQMLYIKTDIQIKNVDIDGFFVVILEKQSMEKVLEGLRRKYG